MSRRSHHPARRHVRPHGESRSPRATASSDGPSAATQAPGSAGHNQNPASNGAQAMPARPKALPVPPPARPAEARPPRLNGHGAPADVPDGVVGVAEVEATPSSEARRPEIVTPAAPASIAGPYTPRAATPIGPLASGGPRQHAERTGDLERNGCTAPQLRRFIKSRAYVPMHELRRRFAIEGGDDEVTPVDMSAGSRVFVGLPNREGRLLGELLKAGDIGYELSMDPISPIVVGVFPMRPVPRP